MLLNMAVSSWHEHNLTFANVFCRLGKRRTCYCPATMIKSKWWGVFLLASFLDRFWTGSVGKLKQSIISALLMEKRERAFECDHQRTLLTNFPVLFFQAWSQNRTSPVSLYPLWIILYIELLCLETQSLTKITINIIIIPSCDHLFVYIYFFTLLKNRSGAGI